MTRARSLVIYADLLPALLWTYAPDAAREQARQQQAARVRLATKARG